jgi:hypothetical protein
VGGDFQVNAASFTNLARTLSEASEILDLDRLPELSLHQRTGLISTYAICTERPTIGVNLEAMEWLTHEELLLVFGQEISRVKGGYLAYQQLPIAIPLLKTIVSNTTLGLGGLAANGIEMARNS